MRCQGGALLFPCELRGRSETAGSNPRDRAHSGGGVRGLGGGRGRCALLASAGRGRTETRSGAASPCGARSVEPDEEPVVPVVSGGGGRCPGHGALHVTVGGQVASP